MGLTCEVRKMMSDLVDLEVESSEMVCSLIVECCMKPVNLRLRVKLPRITAASVDGRGEQS
jgi:hypothetical protein